MALEMRIQQAAKEVGLSPHTLRYYEREGLLDHVPRTEGGIRIYGPDHLQFVRFLTRMRLTGMPIRTMKRYAALVRLGRQTTAERREILLDLRRDAEAQIALLQQNLEVIDLKLDLYDRGWAPEDGPDPCNDRLQTLLREETQRA